MADYVVLLGAPGAGKGTQAEVISETFHLTHVSTGDLFRENIREMTALGKQVKDILAKGLLVPDSVTIAMVEDRLKKADCKNGALLDGFPRTIKQAEALEEMLRDKFNAKVNIVPCIEVDESLLVDRACGRRMCANGHVFHITNKPSKVEGVCDICGEPLYQRKDDTEETVKTRLAAYHEQTAPLIDFYEKRGVLFRVDGSREISAVSAAIVEHMKPVMGIIKQQQ